MSSAAYTHRLYLVRSASHAIKGETALRRAGIPCALIPVPRAISAQCGVCLRVGLEQHTKAEKMLQEAGVEVTETADIRIDSRS